MPEFTSRRRTPLGRRPVSRTQPWPNRCQAFPTCVRVLRVGDSYSYRVRDWGTGSLLYAPERCNGLNDRPWCRRPGSNRYGPCGPWDFKSQASANSATPAYGQAEAKSEVEGGTSARPQRTKVVSLNTFTSTSAFWEFRRTLAPGLEGVKTGGASFGVRDPSLADRPRKEPSHHHWNFTRQR